MIINGGFIVNDVSKSEGDIDCCVMLWDTTDFCYSRSDYCKCAKVRRFNMLKM